MKTKIAVIGLGYVGLPLLVCLEKAKNFSPVGFDIDEGKIQKLKDGISPIRDALVEKYLENNHFSLITTSTDDLKGIDTFIICVPTPTNDDMTPNLKPLEKACETIASIKHTGADLTVIVESTIYPGTCEEIVLPIFEAHGYTLGGNLTIAHCPERINPGDPKWDVSNIPRVLGCIPHSQTQRVADLYTNFLDIEIHQTSDIKVAESAKMVENTFRDINIAYANELSRVFDHMGISASEVTKAASTKPFGYMPFHHGIGVGGHCIAVDPYYLIKKSRDSGYDPKFLSLARSVNNDQPAYIAEKIHKHAQKVAEEQGIKDPKLGLLGLTYKPDIDDTRNSPAMEIKSILEDEYGYETLSFDPHLQEYSSETNIERILDGDFLPIILVHHTYITSYIQSHKDELVDVF